MSIFQPVNFAASRTFCPPRPMARTELIVGDDYFRSLAAHLRLFFVKSYRGDSSRAQSVRNIVDRVAGKTDDVNLFVAQFSNNVLNTHTASTDTGADRIDIGIIGMNRRFLFGNLLHGQSI